MTMVVCPAMHVHTHQLHLQWPTFPQVYIGGEFFGGCDIVLGAPRSCVCLGCMLLLSVKRTVHLSQAFAVPLVKLLM